MWLRLAAVAAVGGFVACGGETAERDTEEMEPAAPAAAAAATTVPDWMTVDEGAQTVRLELDAGTSDANNGWNFNGYVNGNATITVPQGYTVTIEFTNNDVLAHSIGVDERTGGFPAGFENPEPVFEGAISPNPTSLAEATQSGESVTITFTAARAGSYSLVCYVPGHAITGMWIAFTVSDDGSFGVTTGS